MNTKNENNQFNYLTSDFDFVLEAPELEAIEFILPWQRPEFWQEQHEPIEREHRANADKKQIEAVTKP